MGYLLHGLYTIHDVLLFSVIKILLANSTRSLSVFGLLHVDFL